jgi:hypothetical protein
VVFECDPEKEAANLAKHGVGFSTVAAVFSDPRRLIYIDAKHSTQAEVRFYAIGHDGTGILTVRFTLRGDLVRVIGAGYWRKQRKIDENQE